MDRQTRAAHIDALRRLHAGGTSDIRAAFAADPSRFARFSLSLGDLLLDWSKTAVSAETMTTVGLWRP